MTTLRTIPLSIVLFLHLQTPAQVHVSDASLSLFAGTINYQGDLKPNSFTFNHSNIAVSVVLRKPILKWLAWRSGISIGKIEGADRYNRDYLKPRNLSFYTNLKEVYTGLEASIPDIYLKRITPYAYSGLTLFHFNPWTYDNNNQKIYLKPLSTEGQGLPEYPGRKPYKLTQVAVAFGAGLKYAVTESLTLGIEFSQRKTFTDYLDDVSGYFIDGDILLQERGSRAVQISYRGDELPGGDPLYPTEGTQRGTHTEMDWYYFFGLTFEVKFGNINNLFTRYDGSYSSNQLRCPVNFRFQ